MPLDTGVKRDHGFEIDSRSFSWRVLRGHSSQVQQVGHRPAGLIRKRRPEAARNDGFLERPAPPPQPHAQRSLASPKALQIDAKLLSQSLQGPVLQHPDCPDPLVHGLGHLGGAEASHDPQEQNLALLVGKCG